MILWAKTVYQPNDLKKFDTIRQKFKREPLKRSETEWLLQELAKSYKTINKVASAMGISVKIARQYKNPPLISKRHPQPCDDYGHDQLNNFKDVVAGFFTVELPSRVQNALENYFENKNIDIQKYLVTEFIKTPLSELLRINNLGRKSIEEIEKQITDNGIGLCHRCIHPTMYPGSYKFQLY